MEVEWLLHTRFFYLVTKVLFKICISGVLYTVSYCLLVSANCNFPFFKVYYTLELKAFHLLSSKFIYRQILQLQTVHLCSTSIKRTENEFNFVRSPFSMQEIFFFPGALNYELIGCQRN